MRLKSGLDYKTGDPKSLAVVEPDRTITCAELIHQARLRAGQFIAQGVTPGSPRHCCTS